jgi:hypothetical protein
MVFVSKKEQHILGVLTISFNFAKIAEWQDH